MKYLIVNADDLGWAEGVNRGIPDAHRNGIVTSASLLANGAAFAAAIDVAKIAPALGIGVHLNLSDGNRVAAETVPSLLNEHGEFAGGPENLLLRLARRICCYSKKSNASGTAKSKKSASPASNPLISTATNTSTCFPGLFEFALRLASRNNIGAIRVSHEASSSPRRALRRRRTKFSRRLKQGVQARGLKFLARDARALAEAAGIATADYFCGIAQTGEMTNEGVKRLLKTSPKAPPK